MVVLVHLPQDTERTIIPYLNKEETLEGLLNDGYCTWKNKLTKHPETRGGIHKKIVPYERNKNMKKLSKKNKIRQIKMLNKNLQKI